MKKFMLFLIAFMVGCTLQAASDENEENMSQGNSVFKLIQRASDPATLQITWPDAMVRTVQVYTDMISAVNTAGGIMAVTAEIVWKVKGVQSRRLISLSDGDSISGTADAMSIRLGTDTDPVTPFHVAAMVTDGTRAGRELPRFYDGHMGQIADKATELYNVPTNIGVIAVQPSVAGGAGVVNNANFNSQIKIIFITPVGERGRAVYIPGTWYSIPPGVSIIAIENQTGDSVYTNVLWGIDG